MFHMKQTPEDEKLLINQGLSIYVTDNKVKNLSSLLLLTAQKQSFLNPRQFIMFLISHIATKIVCCNNFKAASKKHKVALDPATTSKQKVKKMLLGNVCY